jgi:menaquinone-dependent protoporphyrinogen oxidase
MAVLVAYASKHGSTREIAEAIASTLSDRGREAEAKSVNTVSELADYDAVVLGSAIYYGSWLTEAADFAISHRNVLAQRPVWLFSVGPLGTQVDEEEEQPNDIAELRDALGPKDHRIFFGSLTRDRLGFKERMVVKAVRAPEGDFRNWDHI